VSTQRFELGTHEFKSFYHLSYYDYQIRQLLTKHTVVIYIVMDLFKYRGVEKYFARSLEIMFTFYYM